MSVFGSNKSKTAIAVNVQKEKRCKTCALWDNRQEDEADEYVSASNGMGVCRLNVPIGNDEWTETYPGDWCNRWGGK